MAGIRIDLGKLAKRVPVPRPLAKAADVVNSAGMKVENTLDSAANPVIAAKLRACTVACAAEVTGLADLPRLGIPGGGGFDVALLRLRVERPGRAAECCVRQYVPSELRPRFAPGVQVAALAHESDPSVAIVDWDATGKQWRTRVSWVIEKQQYVWPGAGDWPARGAFEVRDGGRHRSRLEKRRATWRPAVARLLEATTRGAYTDDREDWKFDLELAGGRRARVKERAPHLVLARLTAREGAPVAVLESPDGEVAIDWEATLRQLSGT